MESRKRGDSRQPRWLVAIGGRAYTVYLGVDDLISDVLKLKTCDKSIDTAGTV